MKTQRNYWPLSIALFLVLFFLGTIGLVVMACCQRVDLVSKDYYEDEIRFQKQINTVERTQRLESNATAAYNPATQTVTISLPLHSSADMIKGQIQLYRPSSADLDQNYDLKLDAKGLQTIDASRLREGLWRVKVSWTFSGEDFYFDKALVVVGAKS
jgi:hypothetical protein